MKLWGKGLSFLVAVSMAVTSINMPVFAAGIDFGSYENGINYTIEDGKLDISTNSGTVDMPSKDDASDYPWNKHSEETSGIQLSGVNNIGDNAFRDFTNVTKVTVQSNINAIGESSFEGCTSLTSFSYYLSEKIDVGANAFKNCSNFSSFPWANIKSIGTSAFEGTKAGNGANISLGEATSLTTIPEKAFYNLGDAPRKIILPDSITSVGDYAFAGITSVSELRFTNDELSLGSHVFAGDSSLSDIYFDGTSISFVDNTFAELDKDTVTIHCMDKTSIAEFCRSNDWSCDIIPVVDESDVVVADLNTVFTDRTFCRYVDEKIAGGDHKLDKTEIAGVTELNLARYGAISDLTGIEVFTVLKSLKMASDSNIITANLSNMTSLEEVDFSNSYYLSTLNLEGCTNLKSVKCSGTQVDTLNLKSATELETLIASDSRLLGIDLSNNTKLNPNTLDISGNCYVVPTAYGEEISLSDLPEGFDLSKVSKLEGAIYDSDSNKLVFDGSNDAIGHRKNGGIISYSGAQFDYETAPGKNTSFAIGLEKWPGPLDLYFHIDGISVPDQMYTGNPVEPVPEITCGRLYPEAGNTLDPNYYKITYENNVEVGTATLTVTGYFKYHGSKSQTFRIKDDSVEMLYDVSKNAFVLQNMEQLVTFSQIVNATAPAGSYRVLDSQDKTKKIENPAMNAYLANDIDVSDNSIELKKNCSIDLNGHALKGSVNKFGKSIIYINTDVSDTVTVKNGCIIGNAEAGEVSILFIVYNGNANVEDCEFSYENDPYSLTNAIENINGSLTMTRCKATFGAHFAIEMDNGKRMTLNDCDFTNSIGVNTQVTLIQSYGGDVIINGGNYNSKGTNVRVNENKGAGSLTLNNATFLRSAFISASSSDMTTISAGVPLFINDCTITGGNKSVYASNDVTISGNTVIEATAEYLDKTTFERIGNYALYIEKDSNKELNYNLTGGEFKAIGNNLVAICCKTYSTSGAVENPLTVGSLLGAGCNYSKEVDASAKEIRGAVKIINDNVHVIKYVIPHGVNSNSNLRSFTTEAGTIELYNPVCDTGFTFAGWYKDPEYTEKVISLDKNVSSDYELYAKFEAKQFYLELNANDGTANKKVITKSYDDVDEFQLLPSDFTRKGYLFIGWAYTEDAQEPDFYSGNSIFMGTFAEKLESEKPADETIKLYAVWKDLGVDLKKAVVYFSDGKNSFGYVPGGVRPTTIMVGIEEDTPDVIKDVYYLTEGVDYDVIYTNNDKLGTATAKIVPHAGNEKVINEKTINFKIVANSFIDANGNPTVDVSLESDDPIYYTGKKLTPDVKIKYGEAVLAKDIDYTVSYQNNTNVGAADSSKAPTIIIKGKGTFTGSITKKFDILPKDISDAGFAEIEATESAVYTGSEIKPKIKVNYKDGETVKTLSTSYYTVAYANNVNVGNNSAKIVVTGKGNYTGTLSKTFSITEKSLANISISYASKSIDYSGSDTKTNNKVTVKDGKIVLREGIDYELTYKGDSVNVTQEGVSVYATGKGNYTGNTETKTYKIKAKKYSASQDNTYYTADGSVHKPTITVPGEITTDSSVQGQNKFFAVYSNENSKDPGSYTVKISPAVGNTNYTGNITVKYAIGTKYSLEDATVTMLIPTEDKTKAYTGSKLSVNPIIKYGDEILVLGTNYTLTYKNNVNSGEATVVATGKGDYSGTQTSTFTITPRDISEDALITISNNNTVFSGKKIAAKLTAKIGNTTLKAGRDYEMLYKQGGIELEDTPIDAGTYSIAVKPIGNYRSSKGDIEQDFVIVKKDVSKLSYALPKGTHFTEDVSDLSIVVKDGKKLLSEGSDFTYVFDSIIGGKVNCTITAAEDGNYQNSITKQFSITAASNVINVNALTHEIETLSAIGTESSGTEESDDLPLTIRGHIKSDFAVSSDCPDVKYTLSSVAGNYTNNDILFADGRYELPNDFVGVLTVKIESGDGKSYKKTSKTVKLSVIPKASMVVKTNVLNKKIEVTVQSERVECTSWTEVRYATAPTMKSAKTIKSTSVNPADGLSIISISGKLGTIYYIESRTAYKIGNKTYYSGWSRYNNGEGILINR